MELASLAYSIVLLYSNAKLPLFRKRVGVVARLCSSKLVFSLIQGCKVLLLVSIESLRHVEVKEVHQFIVASMKYKTQLDKSQVFYRPPKAIRLA
jgi:hypothetical protein